MPSYWFRRFRVTRTRTKTTAAIISNQTNQELSQLSSVGLGDGVGVGLGLGLVLGVGVSAATSGCDSTFGLGLAPVALLGVVMFVCLSITGAGGRDGAGTIGCTGTGRAIGGFGAGAGRCGALGWLNADVTASSNINAVNAIRTMAFTSNMRMVFSGGIA